MADYTLTAKLTADASSFKAGFQQAQASLADLQNKAVSAGKSMQQAGQKMADTGKSLTAKITLPIAGVGAMAIKTGAEFEQGMSRVKAISGATGSDFKKLEAQARELGATTQFSATEAASGMEFLAMAGFNTNQILDAMPGMLNLAAAGALDLGAAADISSNIMSGFGIEAEKAGHVSDVLAKAAASANTDVSQLGEAMKYLAPSAKSLGWNMEESTAAVMAFSDAGIQGGMAGQAFASSLTRLADGNGKAAKTAKELGIEFFNANGQMKPLPEVVAELEKGLTGMTDQQKASALTAMFGAEAYKHWAVLLDKGSDALAKNTDMLVNADGAAEEMAKTMNDNLLGRLKELQSAVEDVAISLYGYMQPALEKIVEVAKNMVSAFANLPSSTQATIVAIGALVAIIPPLLIGFGMFISLMGSAVVAMGAILSPVGLIVAGLITLGGAFGISALEGGKFSTSIKSAFDSIGVTIPTTLSSISTGFSSLWESLRGGASGFIDTFKSVFETVFSILGTVIEAVGAFAAGFLEGFNSAGGSITSLLSIMLTFNPIVKMALMILTEFGGEIAQTFSEIGAMIIPLLAELGQSLGQLASAIIPMVMNVISALIPIVVMLATSLAEIVMAVLPILINLFTQLVPVVTMVIETVMSLVTQLLPLVTTIIDALVPVLMILIETFLNIVQAVMPAVIAIIQAVIAVINAIIPVVMLVLSTVINVIANIIAAVTPIIAFVAGIISSIISIIAPIVTFIAGIIASIMSIIQPLLAFTTGIFTTIFTVVSGVFRNILSFITGIIRSVSSVISSLSGIVSGVFNNIFSTVSSVMSRVGNTISTIFASIQNSWTGLTGFVGGVFNGIEGAVRTLTNQVKGFVNGVIRGINAAVSMINLIPGVNISPIPQLQRGTDDWSGGFARMNEGGRGEMVLLPSGSQVIPHDVSMKYAREAGKAQRSLYSNDAPMQSNENINMDGMFRGANFNVRRDEDIYEISRELYRLIDRGKKGRGGGL